jgi:chemotaxis family two-component system response regulator Rcp1
MSENKLEVLIVEDNPGDAYMIKEMLTDLKLTLSITVAKDGQAALNILKDRQNGMPGLVILDLNLPKVNGFEVLTFMKSSPTLRSIPVVVMTGSLRGEDEQRSRELGAVDYCIKPSTADEMERSEMCLRAHLEPLSREKGRNGSGPSIRINLNQYYSDIWGQRIPSQQRERFVMDAFNKDSWKIMETRGAGEKWSAVPTFEMASGALDLRHFSIGLQRNDKLEPDADSGHAGFYDPDIRDLQDLPD